MKHHKNYQSLSHWRLFIIGIAVFILTTAVNDHVSFAQDGDYTIQLRSRTFVPSAGIEQTLFAQQAESTGADRLHTLIQFWDIPTDAQRESLENAGVQLLGYVPQNTWFASIPGGIDLQNTFAAANVRWAGSVQAADKVSATVQNETFGPYAVNNDGTISVQVLFFPDVDRRAAMQSLLDLGATFAEKGVYSNRFTVRLDSQQVDAIAAMDGVQWVDSAPPPKVTMNDESRQRTNVDIVQAAPYNLSGSGVDLGIWDGGIVDSHIDFDGRLNLGDSTTVSNHATHVAGTMAGDGTNSSNHGGAPFQWMGMAPGAEIFTFDWFDNIAEVNNAVTNSGIELSQNSWGYGVGDGNCYLYGDYAYDAASYDEIVTGNTTGKPISVVFANGNERDDGDCGMSSTFPYLNYANVSPPATGKNVLSVGATNSNNDSMTSFSSWGPLDDGRLKPEVVAPGCANFGSITSTMPGGGYGGMCGTSMAAPAVSGIIGLLIEQHRAVFNSDPLPATLKAVLVQTAVDLNDGSSYLNPGPDYASGYGRVDAQAAADLIQDQKLIEDSVGNNQSEAFTFNVPAGTPSIKVTLAWDDEPGTVNAAVALVNNLDLTLIAPDGTVHYPWTLDPNNPSANATTGADSVNNLEQVVVNNPAAGTWQAQVNGTAVPTNLQSYALVGQVFGTNTTDIDLSYAAQTIDDDNIDNSSGDNDGIPEAGETIEMLVSLQNGGGDTATAVNACLTEDSPYVDFPLYNNCSDYPDIAGSTTAENYNDFDFAIADDTPDGHLVTFTVSVNAGNGGPWTDTFTIVINNDGGTVDVALISDQSELTAITSVMDSLGYPYTLLNDNWDGSQGVYTSDYNTLINYDVIIWYASGYSYGRLITQEEYTALEQYLQAGGRLLVTGYDTIGSPTDTLLADLIRSSSAGDGPFGATFTVINGSHPIMNGPYGSFPTGSAFTAGDSDHDQAEADTSRNAVTVAELSDGRDKILATDLDPNNLTTGRIVYWNGNDNVSDWVTTVTNTAVETNEPKRTAEGVPLQNNASDTPQPATIADQVNMLKNTVTWLAEGAGGGGDGNDTPGTCTPLSFDSPANGAINPPGDDDYFCFNGIANQTIAADIDAWTNGSYLDPVLTLFDTDGTTILDENDDWDGLDSYLEFTLPDSGTYYLRVRSYAHPCCGGPDYTYTLLLTEEPRQLPFIDDVEMGLNGWNATGLWHQVEDGVSPYPNSYSPTHSWWYGDDNSGNYDTGNTNNGSLTSPPIVITNNVQAELSFRYWYETETFLSPMAIYFDNYHDTDNDDINGGNYTGWANTLINNGATIDQFNQPIDLANLSNYDALALFDPEIVLSNAEVNAINSFMQNGGHVVVMGEWDNLSNTNTYLNALTSGHGITLNADTVIDPSDNDGNSNWPLIYNFSSDPLVSSINTISMYSSSSLTVSGAAAALATGDGDSGTALVTAAAEDETGTETAVPAAINPNAPIVIATAPVGDGRLIVLGDSSIWTNSDADGDGTAAYSEYDNAALANRFFSQITDNPNWDQKWVQISVDGGPFQNLQQITGKKMRSWHQARIDLSAYAGSVIRIRFHFDTIDNILNDYRGWYIDDIRVEEPNQPVGPIVISNVVIDDDNVANSSGDGDGIPEPGETIELLVELQNLGSATAENVVACISESSNYVNGFLFNECADYGDIAGGDTAVNGGGEDFDFTIPNNTPAGHVINFTLDITADNAGPWTELFDIQVGNNNAPDPGPIVYHAHTINDDNLGDSSGNDDGLINPGETIEMYVDLFNAGLGTAQNVTACLSEDSPYVTFPLFNSCASYGDIVGGDININANDFDFEVSPQALPGHQINFTLTVTDNAGNSWTDSFQEVVLPSGPSLRFVPTSPSTSIYDGSFTVNVMVDNANDLSGFEFDLVYDPAMLHVEDILLGDFLSSTGRSASPVGPNIDNGAGLASFGGFTTGSANGPNGSGVLAILILEPQATGNTTMTLQNSQLTDTDSPPTVYTPPAASANVTIDDSFFADVDNDGDVDIIDIVLVSSRYGCDLSDTCYDTTYDLDNNFTINIVDVQIVACYWGWPSGNFSACYTPTAAASIAAVQNAAVGISPTISAVESVNNTFTTEFTVEGVTDLGAAAFELHYDPNIVEVNSITVAPFMTQNGRTVIFEDFTDNGLGVANYAVATTGTHDGASGNGAVAVIEYTARAQGISLLTLENIALSDTKGNGLTIDAVNDGSVSIGLPALSISMNASNTEITAGDLLTYTISVQNSSTANEATGVTISTQMPNNVSFISASNGGSHSGNTVTWNGLTANPSSTIQVQYTVAVDEDFTGTLVSDTYSATSNEGVSANGTDAILTEVRPNQILLFLPFITKP